MSQIPGIRATPPGIAPPIPGVLNQRPRDPLVEFLSSRFGGVPSGGPAPRDPTAPFGVRGAAVAVGGLEPLDPRSPLGEAAAAATRGVVAAPRNIGMFVAGLFGGPSVARDLGDVLPQGPQPSRDDLTGRIANIGGEFPGLIAQGPLGFAGMSYASTLERTDDQGAALGAGLLAGGLGLVPVASLTGKIPGLRETIAKLGLGKTQELLTTRALEALSTGAANVGIAATTEGVARVAGAEPQPIRPIEQFIVGFLGHAAVTAPGIVRSPGQQRALARAREFFIKDRVVSPEEALLLKDHPGLLVEVAVRRYAGEQVEITTTPDAPPRLTSRPDPVSWAEKVELEHNPAVISAYRESLERGGPRLFFETPRGPVDPSDGAKLVAKIENLRDEIKAELSAHDISSDGQPLTERALLWRDLDLVSKQASKLVEPGGRNLYGQAEALLHTASKYKDSVVPLSQELADLAMRSPGIVTPIDLRPNVRLSFPLERAKSMGLLRHPTALSRRPATQTQLARLQRKTVQRLQVLRTDSRLSVAQKLGLSRVLESEYIERVMVLTNKDNNNAAGTRRAVVKRIVESKAVPEEQQTSVLVALDRAIDSIADRTIHDTQRGTMEKLLEEISDPKYGMPDSAIRLIEDLHKQMLRDETFLPWGERVRRGRDELRRLMDNIAGFGVERARDRIVELSKSLPPEYSAGLLKSAIDAKTLPELEALARTVLDTQESYLRETTTEQIVDLAKSVEKSPQREAVYDLLRALEPKPDVDPVGVPPETPPSKLFVKNPKTGADKLDVRQLAKLLDARSIDELTTLRNSARRIVRRAQIERGLYNKWIKHSTTEDVRESLKVLTKRPLITDRQRARATPEHIAKLIFDPKSVPNLLLQLGGSDPSNRLYKVIVGDLVEPYLRSQQNSSETRRFVNSQAKIHLGIDPDSGLGDVRFARYMREKLKNGIERGEAMWAYALQGDAGRRAALEADGISARGKTFDVDESIALLSARDRAFVDATKRYFQNNPFVERAFSNHLLLNGFEPERSPGWFTSTRERAVSRVATGIDDVGVEVRRSTSALEARVEGAGTPFVLDGGYVSAFYRVSDRLSAYAEMGLQTHRAEKLLTSREFRTEFERRVGREELKVLENYINNVHGFLGHKPSAWDRAMTQLPINWQLSKIALNVASAVRQSFSLMTAMGDNIIDSSALVKALREGAFVNSRVGRTMRQESGVAYMRLQAGKFTENLVHVGDRGQVGTLGLLRDKSFILQKIMDDRTLRVTWRAAEIMADTRKLTGQARTDFVRQTFERALIKNQATNSPLYASELELIAVRNPSVRGLLSLQRELNRQYNVTREHVVRAIQQPTKENIAQAGRALFWIVAANGTASIGVNLIRASILNQPKWDEDRYVEESIKQIAGLWYLAGDTTGFFLGELQGRSGRDTDLAGPVVDIVASAGHAVGALSRAVEAGYAEDEDRRISSGPRRGQDKMSRELTKALEQGGSSLGALLGLPFWALWYQGKGLYSWNDRSYKLMVDLETERARLRADGEEGSLRWKRLEAARERVNQIHRRREKGLLSESEARSQIERELERVLY